jgi:hypothetical protein
MSKRLLAEARRLLPGAVSVVIRDGAGRRLVVTGRDSRLVRPRRIHQAVLCALLDGRLTGKALARKAKYKYNSYFRSAVADLVATGTVRLEGGAYFSVVR